MYRDVVQWSKIRNRIPHQGHLSQSIVRETGISLKTVRKMLVHTHPQLPVLRRRNYSKLGPHTASIQRMLRENATLPPRAKLSVRAIYQRIRDDEGFSGGYNTVADYARSMSRDEDCIWENVYDVLMTLIRSTQSTFYPCYPATRQQLSRRRVQSSFFVKLRVQSNSQQSTTSASRLTMPDPNGCAPYFKTNSVLTRCAMRLATFLISGYCSITCIMAACLIAIAPRSCWRVGTASANA